MHIRVHRTKVYFGDGAAKKVFSRYLQEAGKEIIDFSGIMPNPTDKKVQEGAALAREKGFRFILALGGGSVIDCCKIIAAQAVTEKDIWEMEFEDPVYSTEYLPMGAVVTASGTGAEMNSGAVIANEDTNQKAGVLVMLLAEAG